MPAWIHDRAEHILAKNPKMDKGQAFALATQQSHKMGKSPKGYGTAEGKRAARAKYRGPKKGYVQGANNGKLESAKMTKRAFTVSQYSGPLSMGKFKQESIQPPFISPRVKTGGPPSQRGGKEKKAEHDGLTPKQEAAYKRLGQATGDLSRVTLPGSVVGAVGGAALGRAVGRRLGKTGLGTAAGALTGWYTGGAVASQRPKAREARERIGHIMSGKEKKAAGLAPSTGMSSVGTQTKGPQISFSPTKQLNASKNVGVVKATPPGPSIAQISKPKGFGIPAPGATKATNKVAMAGSLRARAIRLAATDIPNTPRLLMRKRSPKELSKLQDTVEQKIHSVQAEPIMRGAEPFVGALPQAAQSKVRRMVQFAAENPEFVVPGGSALTVGKHGLVKLIDRVAPAAKIAT